MLEKWMFGSMFEKSAKGGSELDAVIAYDDFHPALSYSPTDIDTALSKISVWKQPA